MVHRVISANSVAVKPAAPSGTQQYFSDVPPGTIVPATWLNMLQDEIVTAVALKGITPDPADDTQLAQLLAPSVQVLTGYLAAGSPVSTTTTMGRAVLAAKDSSAGSASSADTRCLAAASENVVVAAADSAVIASRAVSIDAAAQHFIAASGADLPSVLIEGPAIRNAAVIAYRHEALTAPAVTEDCSAVLAAADAEVNGPRSAVVAAQASINAGARSLVSASGGVVIGPGAASACAIIACDDAGSAVQIAPVSTTATCCAALAIAEGGFGTQISGSSNFAAASAGITIDGAGGAARSVVLATSASEMSGQESAIVGGEAATVSGDLSVCLGGLNNEVSSARSAVIGGQDNVCGMVGSVIIGCEDSVITGLLSRVVMLASLRCNAAFSGASTDYQVMGGVNAVSGAPLWRLDSTVGRLHSTVAPTTGGLDYAEWFPNADGVAHPPGRLLARTGRQVTLGQPGRRPIGVVSCSPSIVGGDDSLGWARRHATDEWGRPLYDEVELEGGRTVRVLRPNPEYDPSRAAQHVPRSQRPDEWTLVGLVGQLLVAVEADVAADDFLECGEAGLGRRAAGETRLEVMEIVRPFDPAAGYAQALVLVR